MRAGDSGLIRFDGAEAFADQRLLGIKLLAGDEVGFHQLLITGQVAAGVGEGGGVFRQLPLGLSQRHFELAGIDFGQQIAGFHLLSFLEVQGDQLTVDAAAHGDGIGGGNGPEPGEIARHGFTDRGGGLHRSQRAAAHSVATTAARRALRLTGCTGRGRSVLMPVPRGGKSHHNDASGDYPAGFIAAFHRYTYSS